MKKIGTVIKEASQGRIKNSIKGSSCFFIVKYAGLSSPDITALRLALRTIDSSVFMVKNSTARLALKDINLPVLADLIENNCGLVFAKQEPVDVCRLLYNFSREHDRLKLEGGYLEEKIINNKDIETLAKLPAKGVLRYQAVLALNSPLLRLAVALKEPLRKMVYCLDGIKQKKSTEK